MLRCVWLSPLPNLSSCRCTNPNSTSPLLRSRPSRGWEKRCDVIVFHPPVTGGKKATSSSPDNRARRSRHAPDSPPRAAVSCRRRRRHSRRRARANARQDRRPCAHSPATPISSSLVPESSAAPRRNRGASRGFSAALCAQIGEARAEIGRSRYRPSAPPRPTARYRRSATRARAQMRSAIGPRIIAPMAIIWIVVLILAMLDTGTLTDGRRPEIRAGPRPEFRATG